MLFFILDKIRSVRTLEYQSLKFEGKSLFTTTLKKQQNFENVLKHFSYFGTLHCFSVLHFLALSLFFYIFTSTRTFNKIQSETLFLLILTL